MATLFNKLDETIGKTFDSGDKEIRTWFLVRQNTLPFVLCGLYAVISTIIGPAIMKNRKPLTLRKPMIIFNFFLVATYSITLFILFTNLPHLGMKKFCMGTPVRKHDLTYKLTTCCWVLYILKYIEFIDTLFFILRKKNHSISVLHVVHHTVVPIVGWMMLRTETSGFQTTPVMINGVVHIIMYSYYGLAAIGPHMAKYLWWKKYLTILQMVQFVFLIIFVTIITPLSGCSIVKLSVWMDVLGGVVFLILFYNFYCNTFNTKSKDV